MNKVIQLNPSGMTRIYGKAKMEKQDLQAGKS